MNEEIARGYRETQAGPAPTGIRVSPGRMTVMTAGLCLLATVLASVYMVTYWAGLRGGDRAMVRGEDALMPVMPTGAAPAGS